MIALEALSLKCATVGIFSAADVSVAHYQSSSKGMCPKQKLQEVVGEVHFGVDGYNSAGEQQQSKSSFVHV